MNKTTEEMIKRAEEASRFTQSEGDGFCADDPADFPLGPACDLSGEKGCESCQ